MFCGIILRCKSINQTSTHHSTDNVTFKGGEAATPSWEMFLKQFIFLCIIMFVFLNPAFKATVTIEDERFYYAAQTGGTASKVRVDNVPVILAFGASLTSTFGKGLVQTVDSAFGSIQGARFSDIGFLENFAQLREDRAAPKFAKTEKDFVEYFRTFVQKCALRYQGISGAAIEAVEVGKTSLQNLNPRIWQPQLEATLYVNGYSCEEYYDKMMAEFNKIEKQWENRTIKAMGLNPATAAPALNAMANAMVAAPNNVSAQGDNMNPFVQFKLRASLDKIVGEAVYADSLGIQGAYGQYVNQSVKDARAKLTDISSQSKFIFSLKSVPQALHFLLALLYAAFPFMLAWIAIQGYPSGLKVLYYFVGSLFSFELVKMSCALTHGLITEYTSRNAAETLHGMTAGAINMNDVIHGTAYYEYMATQSEIASTIAAGAIFIIPIVVATGQAKLLAALAQQASAAPQMGGIESSGAAMAKANDANNRDLETVSRGIVSASVMKGIEENNAAIAALHKMDNYNEFNAGQVAQQMNQIGSTAGYGKETMFRGADGFAKVSDGGKFQGVQSAATAKGLGEAYTDTHDFRDRTGISGNALARGLGNDSAVKTIASARGLMSGDFYTREGDLSGGREGSFYAQGLETNARIAANQAAGVGKLGETTREQMNAVQYGAEAQVLNQIAQGRSLQRTYGHGAGFQRSFDAMAETSADIQNITARETAASAREHFNGISGGKGEDSFSSITKSNADLRHDSTIGTAKGYDGGVGFDVANGSDGKVFQRAAEIQTYAQGMTQSQTEKQIGQGIKDSFGNTFNATEGQTFDKKAEDINKSHSQALKQVYDGHSSSMGATGDIGNEVISLGEAAKKSHTHLANERAAAQESYVNNAMNALGNDGLKQSIMAEQVSTMASAGVMNYSSMSANVQGAQASGMMSNGIVTHTGMQSMIADSTMRHHNTLALGDRFGNSNLTQLTQSLREAGMSEVGIASIASASSPAERANRFAALTRSSTLSGTINGRSFNLAAGIDGGYHGSFDSSLNVRGGYNVDMGSVSAATGYGIGGVSGMRAIGMANTGMSFISNTVSNVGMFAPAGGIAKLGANTGLINPNSMYAQGVGKFKEAMREKKSIGENQATSMGNGVKDNVRNEIMGNGTH
ncbi:conjugal transfer protein TraG N-terminal domain-containing protein [Helicobacter hepaticus]|jgi:hypothetical protein|uniref:TraG N-terminal Proteobacteria domain-containing protein n=2 Tax=Helicobacter hepaticus TaxID=32025 RepID=Q7VJG8_HELHP|nr:conjugal transfer protein TraG N-terminal domain-containing protein [Helicobacter hepaticus]AAP76872.1 conserved hypothetical protein [Helicobacter hepaticus ATCC 51449]